MTKTFCDNCDTEIRIKNTLVRWFVSTSSTKFDVTHIFKIVEGNVTRDAHLCDGCVTAILQTVIKQRCKPQTERRGK